MNTIRQFRTEDADSCCEIIHACLEKDGSLTPGLRSRLRVLETPKAVSERARLFYVAVFESEAGIDGVAGLDMNEIRLLCVRPERQHQGIGRALVEHLKEMVPGLLFPDIFVYSSLAAVDFYRACGFTERGRVSFDIDGEFLPTAFMIQKR